MNYRCETNLQEIEKYLRGAGVVAFDFETAPLPAYRDDNKPRRLRMPKPRLKRLPRLWLLWKVKR